MKLESAQEIMSEAELQGTVLDLLQVYGFKCHHTYDSRIAPRGRKGVKRTDKGFPDIIAMFPGSFPWCAERALAIELKKEGEKMTCEQVYWLGCLASMGFERHVWQPHDLNSGEIERIIKGE